MIARSPEFFFFLIRVKNLNAPLFFLIKIRVGYRLHHSKLQIVYLCALTISTKRLAIEKNK